MTTSTLGKPDTADEPHPTTNATTDTPNELRVLVTGDRNWVWRKPIELALRTCQQSALEQGRELVLIHGAARGADRIAAQVALDLGIRIDKEPTTNNPLGGYPANWEAYSFRRPNPAGPIRNQQMLVEGRPDVAIAFHPNIAASKGTKHMLGLLDRADVPYTLCEKPW